MTQVADLKSPRTQSGATHPLPGLVVQRSSHVDGAGHVLDGEGTAEVAPGDFVTDTGCWKIVFEISNFLGKLKPIKTSNITDLRSKSILNGCHFKVKQN